MKKEFRKKMLALRDAAAAEVRAESSKLICENLFKFPLFTESKTVMFFVSFRSEVETLPMIEGAIAAGMRVVVPVTQLENGTLLPSLLLNCEDDLVSGTYGVLEPKPEAVRPIDSLEIDMVMMPGAAFDRSGGRIGYGGGFYDRFIENLRPDVVLAALAFDFQVVDSVPTEAHDRKIHYVITDREIIDCKLSDSKQ